MERHTGALGRTARSPLVQRGICHLAPFRGPRSARRAPALQSTAAPTEFPAGSHVLLHPVPFKAAIDFKYIKDNLQAIEQNCKDRNSTADPKRAVELYDEFVRVKLDVDRLRAERNSNSAQMKVRGPGGPMPCANR